MTGNAYNPIPDDVRRFVLTSVPSVPFVEAALLLRRQPGQAMGVAEVAAALYIREQAAAELLEGLCLAGAIERENERYRFAPRDERLAGAWDRLAEAYSANLIGVTNLIHDATQKSAQRFADAFKLRKDS
ncbi:MAG: hypothetical protein AB1430_05790 [Pseudomonadota bacterium]